MKLVSGGPGAASRRKAGWRKFWRLRQHPCFRGPLHGPPPQNPWIFTTFRSQPPP